MMLQVIYVIIALFGFNNWRKDTKKELKVSKLSKKEWFFYFPSALILCIFTFLILKLLQGELPILDALTNGFAILATYLAAKKKLDNWLIWIPVNMLTIYMVYSRGMPFYSVLYFCYLLFAVIGFFQWNKSLKAPN